MRKIVLAIVLTSTAAVAEQYELKFMDEDKTPSQAEFEADCPRSPLRGTILSHRQGLLVLSTGKWQDFNPDGTRNTTVNNSLTDGKFCCCFPTGAGIAGKPVWHCHVRLDDGRIVSSDDGADAGSKFYDGPFRNAEWSPRP